MAFLQTSKIVRVWIKKPNYFPQQQKEARERNPLVSSASPSSPRKEEGRGMTNL